MKSIRDIYKIGKGPSSSHTMGPAKAMSVFVSENPDAESYKVILYGSLADTGRGHGTDVAISKVSQKKPVEIVFDTKKEDLPHENTMEIFAFDREGKEIGFMQVLSIGGGDIKIVGREEDPATNVYRESSFSEIAEKCKSEGIRLSDFVFMKEGEGIKSFLYDVWETMKASIHRGLTTSGILPGGLMVERKAQYLYNQRHIDESPVTRENRIVCAYAYAVSEENADNGTIVTAPTCGACAVLPSVLKYMQEKHGFSDLSVIRALATAGLIGTLTKTNASIS